MKREDIRKEIQDEAPGLGDLGPSPVSGVPDGYFDAFPDKLMGMIRKDEMSEELAEYPTLAAAPRISPYTVPHGYFESLTSIIGDKKFEEAPTRVVQMGRKLNLYKKCLIAAAIAGIISIGAVFLFKDISDNSVAKQMAQLSDQDMIEYLQYRTDDFDNEDIFANASTEATEDSITSLSLPDGLTEEDLDAILEDNLLKDVSIN